MPADGAKKSALRSSRFANKAVDESSAPTDKPKSRLSFLSSMKGDSKKGDKTSLLHMDEREENIVEKDPVMELLEARTTQRVRFSLDSSEENPKADASKSATDKQSTSEREPPNGNGKSIKNFMLRNLFNKGSKSVEDELNDPELAEANNHSMLWKSAVEENSDFIHTSTLKSKGSEVMVSFTENPKTRAEVVKLLNKGKRAMHKYFRYEYAVKCHVTALELLNKANYPKDHPTMIKTVDALNSAHHALSSFVNSANIVKSGIRCEDSGDLVRALKMYTIAYRIRRDNLSRVHPSLVVLLNILGSIQVKRGELDEAMQVFELALRDTPLEEAGYERAPSPNLVARSVTYREMGGIHEKLGNIKEAVEMYHSSLECATQWRQSHRMQRSPSESSVSSQDDKDIDNGPLCPLNDVQFSRTGQLVGNASDSEGEGMELFLGEDNIGKSGDQAITDFYYSFFPPYDDKLMKKKGKTDGSNDRMDLDIALTLHQIAQMYRHQGQHGRALDAYGAALRGMKHALGPYHPNVAAILGNMGNLQNEMGDYDAAYDTYQEVLGIESYRLGFSHPEVAVSIHNIATIEVARGNFDHALSLYAKVLALEKKLYGEQHPSVAVTASCMGDVHAKLGDIFTAMDLYEQAFKIKSTVYGRHHLEVARMLHKMGKTAFQQRDYNLADSYISRAFLLYRMNKLPEEHEWVVDAYKDGADVDAAIVMGGDHFEC
jgi:tetratricopeptide (TPR) repeat protein